MKRILIPILVAVCMFGAINFLRADPIMFMDAYLPLTGGTLTGAVNITPATAVDGLYINQANATQGLKIDVGASGYQAINIDSNSTGYGTIYAKGFAVAAFIQDISNGYGLTVERSIAEAGSFPLGKFINDNTVNEQPTLFVDHDGIGGATGYALYVDSENAAAPAVMIESGYSVGLKVDKAIQPGTTWIHSVVVTLTTAQINALRATPITIVAAQGANTIIELVSVVLTYDYATAAFTVGADEDLVIEYADGTDATASIETAGFLDQVDDEVRFYPSVLAAGADLEASINQGLRIFNTGTGETADGGGEVDIRIVYRVYATGF